MGPGADDHPRSGDVDIAHSRLARGRGVRGRAGLFDARCRSCRTLLAVRERDPSEDESDGVQDDEEEEAEEDRWPTLGQALRHSIAYLDVEPREAYDAYDSTEEYEYWLTHLDNGGAVHPDDRE